MVSGYPKNMCYTELHCQSIDNLKGRLNMAANALVQARIDQAVKKEAAIVLAAIGLTVSDAVRLLLTRIAHDHALPFDPLTPNETTIAAMKEARDGKLESFDNVGALIANLNEKD